jgi:hypothetical protein
MRNMTLLIVVKLKFLLDKISINTIHHTWTTRFNQDKKPKSPPSSSKES